MNIFTRTCTTALAAVILAVGLPAADAQAGGRHGGGHGGHGRYYGPGWGGVGLGFGIGTLFRSDKTASGGGDSQPTAAACATIEVTPARPDPIIYPRNGQSAQQTEADRQECNRWATTQPSAMSDASVFNRATEACMDGRGYTLR